MTTLFWGRLFPLAGMLLRRERDRACGRLPLPQPPSPSAPPPREVLPGVPFPTCITAEQVSKEDADGTLVAEDESV